MKSVTCWFSVILVAVMLMSCAAPPRRSDEAALPRYSEAPSKDAEALWRKAEDARKAGDIPSSINYLDRIVQGYPKNIIAAKALHKAGVLYLEQGQPERAVQYFDYLLYTYPGWNGTNQARLDRLRALAAANKRREAEKEAMPLWDAAEAQPEVRVGLCALMTELYAGDRDLNAAFDWASAGFAVAKTPEENKQLTQALLRAMNEAGESALRKLDRKNPSEFMKVFIEYRLGQLEMQQGQPDAAKERLRALLNQNPSHPIVPEIQIALRGAPVESGLAVNPNKIGCLLPLNGPYAKYGEVVMRGLSLASTGWNETHPGQPVTLVIKDSQADAALAAGSFEELVAKEGVLAVIGPLGAQPAAALAPVANRLGVPMLTLTQKEETPSDNSFVLNVFLDNREMIRTIVRYCREKLGYTRFATLYPDDRYGQKNSKVFGEIVQELGGNMLASVSYKPKTTDFKEPITKLMSIAKKNGPPSGIESTPFEALFLPDQVQTVSLIAPQLPYYNVVGATLLGTNLWSEGPIAQAGGAYVERAVFATPYYVESQSAQVRDFRQKYEGVYQTVPTYLEAQAYDALALLLDARSALPAGGTDRVALLQNILKTRNYQGVAGSYSFDAKGDLQRNYLLMQVVNGQVVQLSQ